MPKDKLPVVEAEFSLEEIAAALKLTPEDVISKFAIRGSLRGLRRSGASACFATNAMSAATIQAQMARLQWAYRRLRHQRAVLQHQRHKVLEVEVHRFRAQGYARGRHRVS